MPASLCDPSPSTSDARTLDLVFFITGNPGLIAYYHPFLAGVVQGFNGRDGGDLSDVSARPVVVVAGFSLGGFEVEDWTAAPLAGSGSERGQGARGVEEGEEQQRDREALRDLLFPDVAASPSASQTAKQDSRSVQRIYSLAEQVELCYARLENLLGRLRMQCDSLQGLSRSGPETLNSQETTNTSTRNTDINLKVTLIGHSVGAYIALELVRLRHEYRQQATAADSLPKLAKYSILSCILLTPTIQDLHLSSSGRIASPLLAFLPFLPSLAQGLVQNVLVKFLSEAWFEVLVKRATGMQAASHGLVATVAFLRSRRGVCQALEMAKCELREIRKDSWGNEVWGIAAGDGAVVDQSNPSLFFWFARRDHWVADVTREEILSTRGGTGFIEKDDKIGDDAGKDELDDGRNKSPRIRIDETDGLMHAWCLTQSDLVVRRVNGWLRELWDQD
ncbi:hypothetical protein LTR84_008151 [Exophiala bonariae]|uniref:Uncharacterized protein n=1 Tax=Exophiala bonariae TaxID=1690606 RepID=A0AAV9NPI3_9EURO|nr:hypothetical protein LTR84_008151 [Exophiala bonariae]